MESPFAVDVVGNGCPVSSPIIKDPAAVELEFTKHLQEEKRVKRSGVLAIELWKKILEQNYSITKDC